MNKNDATRIRRQGATGALLLALLAPVGCHRDPNKQKLKYLESGKRYAAEAKYKEAAIQFSNALKVDRNYAEAHYQLGTTYIKMGSIMPGYGELMRAVALQPGNSQARIDLGNLLLAGHQTDRAEQQAQAVLAMNANNADAHALLSSIAASKGDRTEALAQINQALAIDPSRAQFHTALGLLAAGDPASAGTSREQLEKAVALDGKNVVAHLALANLSERQNDKAGALAQYKAAVANDPKSLLARNSLAGFFQRQGDSAAVEATLRQATEDLADTPGGAELLQNYYVHSNQVDKGLQVYNQLVREHPKSVNLRLVDARFLIATHHPDQARPIIADLVKTDGSNPDVAILHGLDLLESGKVNDAVDSLQKAAKNNPDNAALRLWLGRAATRKGDLALAQQSFTDAQKLNPTNVEARDGLAQVAMQRHDPSLLRQVGEGAIKAAPQSAVGYLWRGMAEAGTNPDAADTDLRQALKLDPKNWAASLELGALALSRHKDAEARASLQQALAENPNSDRALGLLASMELQNKQPEKALALVQEQIGKVPNNPSMYVQLAELQMRTGDNAGALASAQKAVQLAPTNGLAVMALSRAELARGDAQSAINAWQSYLMLKPTDAQGYAVLGSLQQARGENQTAADSYKKALSIQPDQPVANNNLAFLMIQSGGNTDVALSYAQAARRAMPNAPNTADTLGWVYYTKGTYTSARDLLEQAEKGAPDDAAIQYHLGMTYKKLANEADATTHLKKAIALAPDSDTARDAQKALGGQAG